MVWINIEYHNIVQRNLNIVYFYVFFFIRAGKPPVGLHLDVLKGDKLIQVSLIKYTYNLYIYIYDFRIVNR